jgi:hypothetical protein
MIGFASRRDGHMSILEPNAVGASIRRMWDVILPNHGEEYQSRPSRNPRSADTKE